MKIYVVTRVIRYYRSHCFQVNILGGYKGKEKAWECIGNEIEKIYSSKWFENYFIEESTIIGSSAYIYVINKSHKSDCQEFMFKIDEIIVEDDHEKICCN